MAGEFDCIADQIGEDLLETQRVDQYIGCVVLGFEFQRKHQAFLSGQAIEYADNGICQVAQVDALRGQVQAAGLNAGYIENIADQFQKVVGRVIGDLNGRAVKMPLIGALEGEFQQTDHGNQWLYL